MAKMVLEAMASSRILPDVFNYRTRTENPAKMFTDFKSRYTEQKISEKNKTKQSHITEPEDTPNTNIKPKH